jgi:phosphoribosylformylglycinamidine synthase PurS subunit
MKARVMIRLKSGVLDVQGKAVESGILSLGVDGVQGVRVGKLIEFDIAADSRESAEREVDGLCKKLLANTVIESYEITIE